MYLGFIRGVFGGRGENDTCGAKPPRGMSSEVASGGFSGPKKARNCY